tara:strand:+ start:847 stop:2064 length:1218 start_codon:yes stop_codon:yes gene_type:complete
MKMVVKPKVRSFICTTAHPEGCAKNVSEQITYVENQGYIDGAKNVLIIGASTGYGLASRIVSAYACGANTLGVAFEKPSNGKKTASAGWYNTAAFEHAAHEKGLYAKTINGDAFSDEIKQQVIDIIQQEMNGKVDLIIYSLASPVRKDPQSGELHRSALKPIGEVFNNKTVDVMKGEVTEVTIEPATEAEIADTVKVMGGEDWQLWIDKLLAADVLDKGCTTIAYSYIGPELTHAVYKNGTIGQAKVDLEKTAKKLNKELNNAVGGHAYISVNKALVTQASAAIPVVPLYMSLLFKLMKAQNLHEGCIEQIYRLFKDKLYTKKTLLLDENDRIRIDDWEMKSEIQDAILPLWLAVTTENLKEISDIAGYQNDFYQLFGFNRDDVNYDQEVDIAVHIPSIPKDVAE